MQVKSVEYMSPYIKYLPATYGMFFDFTGPTAFGHLENLSYVS